MSVQDKHELNWKGYKRTPNVEVIFSDKGLVFPRQATCLPRDELETLWGGLV